MEPGDVMTEPAEPVGLVGEQLVQPPQLELADPFPRVLSHWRAS